MDRIARVLRRRTVLLGLIAFACGAWAAAHTKSDWEVPEEAKKMKNPVPSTAAALAAGKSLYTEKCASCHGDTGNGQGPQASMYSVKPADFTEAGMMSEMTDGEIFWKMSEGRRPMPSYKRQFTEEQRWQLVDYIRSLAKRPPAPSSHAHTPPHK